MSRRALMGAASQRCATSWPGSMSPRSALGGEDFLPLLQVRDVGEDGGFGAGEDGRRTFGLSEIMVNEQWRDKGIAHALHDELLSARQERRATLLVEPENVRARRAYLHWGWEPVSQLRPNWDNAPLFEVMVLLLPVIRKA